MDVVHIFGPWNYLVQQSALAFETGGGIHLNSGGHILVLSGLDCWRYFWRLSYDTKAVVLLTNSGG